MTMHIRRLIQVALGVAGGLAAWPVMELLIRQQGSFSGYMAYTVFSGALFGHKRFRWRTLPLDERRSRPFHPAELNRRGSVRL